MGRVLLLNNAYYVDPIKDTWAERAGHQLWHSGQIGEGSYGASLVHMRRPSQNVQLVGIQLQVTQQGNTFSCSQRERIKRNTCLFRHCQLISWLALCPVSLQSPWAGLFLCVWFKPYKLGELHSRYNARGSDFRASLRKHYEKYPAVCLHVECPEKKGGGGEGRGGPGEG